MWRFTDRFYKRYLLAADTLPVGGRSERRLLRKTRHLRFEGDDLAPGSTSGVTGGVQEGTAPPASPPISPPPAAPPAAPAATIPLEGTPYVDPTQTPAAPATTPPGTPAAATAAQQWQSARDYARGLGFDVGNAADDATFLQNVLRQSAQSQQYQQQLQFMANQNAALIRAQQGQPVQPAPQPAQPKKWFQAPEFNPAWEQMIRKDDQGNLTLVPGASPDVLPKYLAYQQHRREFADKLLSDPEQTLSPFVADLAEKKAQEMVQRHLQGYQDQVFSTSFINENTAWLHARDGMGNPIRNPGGQPILSPAGQRFHQYVVQAEQLGVHDVRAQANYARDQLQRELLLQQYQQQQQQQVAVNQNAALIQAGNRQPNMGGTVQPLLPNTTPAPQNPGLSLRDQLTQAMQQNGFNEATPIVL